MATTNFIDQIPDYFAGDLSPTERQAFEKALKKDTALKEAVAIWQELDEVLAPAPEDKLLENIARLRTSSVSEPLTKPWSWPWTVGIPVLLLIAALGWYFWPEGRTMAPVAETPPSIIVDPLETLTDTLKVVPEDSLPIESVSPPSTPDPPFRRPTVPTQEGESEKPQPLVFAANYDPNPLIEAEMTEQLRGGEIELKVTNPTTDERVKSENGSIHLAFAGTLTTDFAEGAFTIRLLLLSNALEDYQQANFIAVLPTTLTPVEGGYSFAVNGTAKVTPGLYYYFLEWEEEETYLEIGRLRVDAGN